MRFTRYVGDYMTNRYTAPITNACGTLCLKKSGCIQHSLKPRGQSLLCMFRTPDRKSNKWGSKDGFCSPSSTRPSIICMRNFTGQRFLGRFVLMCQTTQLRLTKSCGRRNLMWDFAQLSIRCQLFQQQPEISQHYVIKNNTTMEFQRINLTWTFKNIK